MEEKPVFIGDIESITRIASEQAEALRPQETPVKNENVGEKIDSLTEKIKASMGNMNMESLTNLVKDPASISKLIEENKDLVSPDLIEQAKKIIGAGGASGVLEEMRKRGMDPHALKSALSTKQKILQSLNKDGNKSVIVINQARKLKNKKISHESINISASHLLKCVDPVELSCSRLAVGPLAGKTVKIWYDPSKTSRNRRASKLLGFNVGGDIMILVKDGGLSEEDFIEAEAMLD
jgi:hypothetical protein